jgi:hypothetical protein
MARPTQCRGALPFGDVPSLKATCGLLENARHCGATDPIAFFTLWLVIFTAVLSGVGVIQLELLGRTETVSEKSAAVAKKAADVAERGLVAVERPIMSVNSIDAVICATITSWVKLWW